MAEAYAEREIFSPVSLCDSAGNLNREAVGWSRHPLHHCALKGHPLRKKRWNYWCVTSPHELFSVTLSNVDYLGLPFVYYINFDTLEMVEKNWMTPLGRGCVLGDEVYDDASYRDEKASLSIQCKSGNISMRLTLAEFGNHPLEASLTFQQPAGHESLSVVIPWSDKNFQFTSKHNTLPASGVIRWGERKIRFSPDQSFACLDFGRGIWPYKSFWNWSSFSTRLPDGRTLGLNLGAGWTDGTGMNENGFCLAGRLRKISQDVRFIYDATNFMAPWQIKTELDDSVALTFTPFFERIAKSDALIIRSEVHQMLGRFSGTLRADNGERIAVNDVIGWAEDHHARW